MSAIVPSMLWPTPVELAQELMREDEAFSAWVRAIPDKFWAKYDLSAIRLGYELGLRVAKK